MGLYPLRLTFNEGPQATTIIITQRDWKFATPADRSRFEAMPTDERLSLRRQFEMQVALARTTPTKGDQT
jgi:hypothetical protein